MKAEDLALSRERGSSRATERTRGIVHVRTPHGRWNHLTVDDKYATDQIVWLLS